MSRRITLRRELAHGAPIPSGWRLAWYEPRRRVGIYYPAPLHWLLRLLRELRFRLRVAVNVPAIERVEVLELERAHGHRVRLADEYARGYMVGWRECFHACIEAVEDELAQTRDAWEIGALLTAGETPEKQN